MSPWPGWEKFVPPTRAQSRSSTSKTLMISHASSENIKDLARAQQALSRKSKYGAEPTTVDRIRFDSKREAARYAELCVLRDQGLITDLELQPQFPLSVITPAGTKVIIGRYISDFRYRENGEVIVEDCKGYRGKELWIWKRKHVEAEFGITIRET